MEELDTQKIGIAAAKAMEYLDDLENRVEDVEGFEISEVMVVVMLDRVMPTRNNPGAEENLTYVGCTDERVWAKLGILEMALRIVETDSNVGDDEIEGEDDA